MPSLDTLLTVIIAGLILSVSPGPSMLYVLSRSVGQSRVAGLASALGLALGGVALAVVAASGLAIIFERSPLLYQAVTTLGALYIIYLGVQLLFEAKEGATRDSEVSAEMSAEASAEMSAEASAEMSAEASAEASAEMSAEASAEANQVKHEKHEKLSHIVYQGILVELLNPKTVLFFVAFLPPFVDPTRGDVTAQLLILGLLVPLTALPSDLVVAFVGGTIAERLKTSTSSARALTLIGAWMLIAIGVSVFFY